MSQRKIIYFEDSELFTSKEICDMTLVGRKGGLESEILLNA